MVYVNKEYKTPNDEPVNYSKLILRTDADSELSDNYGSVKLMEFDPNPVITANQGVLLCSRWIQRYAEPPKDYKFKIEERKRSNFELGTIVEVESRDIQTPAGDMLVYRDRVQVTQIKPT